MVKNKPKRLPWGWKWFSFRVTSATLTDAKTKKCIRQDVDIQLGCTMKQAYPLYKKLHQYYKKFGKELK